MAGFIRRYTNDPGIEELTAIEGTVIIDREPAATLTGLGSGVVALVGEFEDGCPNECIEVMSGDDFASQYGGFGFVYDGVASNNPSARVRRADGAVLPEYWNGNGFISAVNKRFRRLLVTRVDTTVGEVSFTRLARVLGNALFNWNLATGDWLELELDRSSGAAAAAVLDGTGGATPQVMAGAEAMTVTIDAGTPYAQTVTVTMTAGSTSDAQVVALLNAAFGTTQVTIPTAGTIRIVGRVKGTLGNVTIDAIHATLTTLLGYAAAATSAGTGASPVWVTVTGAVATMTSAAGAYPMAPVGGESFRITVDAGLATARTALVQLLSTDTTQTAVIARINLALGYTAASDVGGGVTQLIGLTAGTSGSIVITDLDPAIALGVGLGTLPVAGTGNVADLSQVTFGELKALIEAAGGTSLAVDRGVGNELRIANTSTSGAVRTLQATGGELVDKLGLSLEEASADDGTVSVIQAGARVRNAGGSEWVVARTVVVDPTDPGPYTARVRPAVDDGTAVSALAGTVTVVPAPINNDSWAVINLTTLGAAMTESQIDAAYATAIAATKNSNTVAKEATLIVSSRQSNAIRQLLRANALEAGAEGLRGRMAVISPPLGSTTRLMARSMSAQPGVGAYRSDRVIYAYPGAATYVPQIANRGTAGGAGFTVDGFIDTHFDVWVASLCSRLNPEENPGQLTDYLVGIAGIERGNADVQAMEENDYRAFKAAGIAALRIDEGQAIIQSGKTSVLGVSSPALVNISRRRMADFIQDSLAARTRKLSKRLSTKQRRAAVLGEIDSFLTGLKSENNPASQRIDDYALDGVGGNTPETLAVGLYRIKIKVRLLSSMDVIVLDTEIGESVTITEAA